MTSSDPTDLPGWAAELADGLADCIEFKSLGHLEARYSAPDETAWGIDLIELAPAPLEIVEAGPLDGERVYDIVHNFDLLAAQTSFDEVISLSFGFENDGRPCITLEGRLGGREIVVQVYFEPFADAPITPIAPGG